MCECREQLLSVLLKGKGKSPVFAVALIIVIALLVIVVVVIVKKYCINYDKVQQV